MMQRCAPALIAYQRGFLNFTACELSRDIIRREGKRERESETGPTRPPATPSAWPPPRPPRYYDLRGIFVFTLADAESDGQG